MKRFWRWSRDRFVSGEISPELARLAERDPELGRYDSFLVLPPLWDHHGHILAMGALSEQADLRGAKSLEDALSLIRAKADALPEGGWLLGFGWDQNLWGGRFPNRFELDKVTEGRPAYLRRIDGHAAWVNTRAISCASINGDGGNPQGGRFIREEGWLTGILIDNAMAAVETVIPPPGDDLLRRRALECLQALKGLGLAGATDMGLRAVEAEIFAAMDAGSSLPVPVLAYLNEDPRAWLADWSHTGKYFQVEGAKLFADGSLGSRTAALYECYEDEPGNIGLLILSEAELGEMFEVARKLGISLAIHVIGDGAAESVLDALEHEENPPPIRLEHAQVLKDGQVARMARLGVTASVQPCHWLSDKAWAPQRLGEERMRCAYRLGSLARAGIPLLLGSDFPIEDPDPRRNIYSAIVRPQDERISFGQAIQGLAPPKRAFSSRTATLVAGASPEDLQTPERVTCWTLRAIELGDSQ